MVALVGSKGGGKAAVETINRLTAIVGISRSMWLKSMSIFSKFFSMQLMVWMSQSEYAGGWWVWQ